MLDVAKPQRAVRFVQALTHNTWKIDANDELIVNIVTHGHFSIFNYGPGNVWCNWRDDVRVGVDDENSLKLAPNMGYNWSSDTYGSLRALELMADAEAEVILVVGG
jgi:hypothetical protein